MDITRFKNNRQYYNDSYVVATEIILSIKGTPELNLHIDEVYFDDMLAFAPMGGSDWKGFTRDFHEGKSAWECFGDNKADISDIDEYLTDILYYTDKLTKYEETTEVFDLIVDFLTYAKQTGQTVVVEVS